MTNQILKTKHDEEFEYSKLCEEYRGAIYKLQNEQVISSYKTEINDLELRQEVFNEFYNKVSWLSISHPNRGLNWYYDVENVPNQEAIFNLIDFLEKLPESVFEKSKYLGSDNRTFKPSYVYFMNILFRQIDEMKYSYKGRTTNYIAHLRDLPLSDREIYLLLGCVLFWHGGYPVTNLDPQYSTVLRLVEKEFLKMYPDENLPEKEFCKDIIKQKELKDLGTVANRIANSMLPQSVSDTPKTPLNAFPNEKHPIKQQRVKPIQLDMEQRQIIYLFQKLIDEKLLNETKNPTVWDLVTQYFTDKDGRPIANIHQNKDGLKNTKTGKPKKNADVIERVINDTKNQNSV